MVTGGGKVGGLRRTGAGAGDLCAVLREQRCLPSSCSWFHHRFLTPHVSLFPPTLHKKNATLRVLCEMRRTQRSLPP
eukprot:2645339-Rhodomonas_salina.4